MLKPQNYVAKYARAFNKATVQRDKKNDYQRKPKHAKEAQDARHHY